MVRFSIFELELKSDSPYCKEIGGGMYEFNLDYQELKQPYDNMRLGLKNLELPCIEKTIKFKMAIFGRFEKFDRNLLRDFEITYDCHEQLAARLEVTMNTKFAYGQVACLNFATPHSRHICTNMEMISKKLQVFYSKNRFFVNKMDDCKIALSLNFCQLLEIDKNVERIENGILIFADNCIMSDKNVLFVKPPKDKIYVALYNCLNNYYVSSSGQRWPILFGGKVTSDVIGQYDKLLAIKTMMNRVTRRFSVGFYDAEMNPYFDYGILKQYPIKFVFVFMKPFSS